MTNKEKAELFLSKHSVRVVVTMPSGKTQTGHVANYPAIIEDDTDNYILHPDWNRVRVKIDEEYFGHCSPVLERITIIEDTSDDDKFDALNDPINDDEDDDEEDRFWNYVD